MRVRLVQVLFLLLLAFSGNAGSSAQDVSSVTGLVTDSTGAVVSGASVVLLDTKTNTTYEAKTSSKGDYTISSVKPGPGYKLTISFGGFQSVSISNVELGVGRTVTENATLTAGSSQTVEVNAKNAQVTIDTVDATIGNNLDVRVINNLPVQARDNVTILFNLQPGVASGSVTGARTDQTETTVDGLDVNDLAAGQAGAGFQVVSTAPVDSVEEFRGTVAGQLASNGPGSGGQFQLVTKSGTNHFHGDLNEYHRDAQLQANNYFNKNLAVPVRRPPLIQNQFGGAIGGPILKDRAFFFFDFNDSQIIQATTLTTTVPLDSFRSGNVNYILAKDAVTGAPCLSNSRLDTTPNCIGTQTAAQSAALDPKKVGVNQPLLDYINARYPHANDLNGGNGINTGGYRFNAPAPYGQTTYVARLDYNLTPTMKLFVRGTINRRNSTQTQVRFLGDPVSNPFVDRSYSYVAGHIWQIGSNKVNQLEYGSTISKYNFPSTYDPTGTTSLTLGGLTNPYNTISTQTRRIPVPELRDDFNWTKGTHTLGFGGTFKAIKTHSLLLNDFNFVSIGLGGNTGTLNAGLRPSNILLGSTSSGAYDTAFALALGRIGNIATNYNYDNKGNVLPLGSGATRRYRYYQTELYAGDTWKATQRLTLTYGVRYQYYSVPFEANGLQSEQNIGFDSYFGQRLAQSATNVAGVKALPLISYTLGGKANNGPNVYQPNYKDFAPRFAFAYNPAYFQKLVINGGIGLVYDRTVVNAVNFIQDQSSYLFQQNGVAEPFGVAGQAAFSLLNDPRVGNGFGTNFAIPAPAPAPASSIHLHPI